MKAIREDFRVYNSNTISYFQKKGSILAVIMDQESNQMEQQSVQCRNGCGFYGNAGSEGYCSVCYKEVIKKKQQPPTNMPSSLAPTHGTMASLSIDEASCSRGTATAASQLKSTSLNTASPTVLIPPSQMEKVINPPSKRASTNRATENSIYIL